MRVVVRIENKVCEKSSFLSIYFFSLEVSIMAKGNNEEMALIGENLKDLGIYCDTDLVEFNKEEYNKIDSSLVGRIDSVMQIIPTVLHFASSNPDTYRVIYDKGLGTLQKVADNPNLFRGNVVEFNTNNKIKASATLKKTSMLPNVASGIFSAMSLITGQYYMSRINSKLGEIEDSVKYIQQFLENDKRCRMESEEEFLRSIQENYQSILDNDAIRIVKLSKIESIKIDSLANLKFYRKQIGDLKYIDRKKDKAEDVISNIKQISYLISGYWYSLYLYSFASFLEPIIGKHYDEAFIKSIKDDLWGKCADYNDDIKLWNLTLKEYIEDCKAFDENKLLKAIKTLSDNSMFFPLVGSFVGGPVGGFFGVSATKIVDAVDSSSQKNKQQKKSVVLEIYEGIKKCQDIKAIEAKQDDLMLFNDLYNGRLEIVKDKDEMYIKMIK